jgi:hypothetical protein
MGGDDFLDFFFGLKQNLFRFEKQGVTHKKSRGKSCLTPVSGIFCYLIEGRRRIWFFRYWVVIMSLLSLKMTHQGKRDMTKETKDWYAMNTTTKWRMFNVM